MRVAVFYAPGNSRSTIIGKAMFQGIRHLEREVELLSSISYRRPMHDVAVFYGLADGLRTVFKDYRETGRKAVYIDLGYWGRRKRTRFDGYHKFALNARHPTEYFQRTKHSAIRFGLSGRTIEPWRKPGSHIVVVGMSAKGALAEGHHPQAWERSAIERLRALTKRPIIYRPKPNWVDATPIPGSTWMREESIEEVLRDAYAVVTHHSNVAVDGLLAGVPCISEFGVASVMGSTRIEDIENLPRPDGRAQWAADLAHTQWTLAEMQSGHAWAYLKTEVLR